MVIIMNKAQLKHLLKSRIDAMVEAMDEIQPGFDFCQLRLQVNTTNDKDEAIEYVVRAGQYATENDMFFTESVDVWIENTDTGEHEWPDITTDFGIDEVCYKATEDKTTFKVIKGGKE